MKNYRLIGVSGITGVLILAIIANVLFNLLPNFLYGFHSFFGYDLIGLLGRVNAFYYRNVPMECNACGYIETYPPGFHVFLASIKFLTNFDSFQLDICFRVIYNALSILLVFIIVNKVSRKYTISVLLMAVVLVTTVTTATGYASLGAGLQASTGAISGIFTATAIFAIFCLFSREKRERRDIPYYILFFLTFTAHGVSHVGGMVMEISLIGSAMLFFILYHLIFGENRQFLVKSFDLISLALLSFAVQFMIHWWKILEFLSMEGRLSEDIEWYFGITISPSILNKGLLMAPLLLTIFSVGLFIFSRILERRKNFISPQFIFKVRALLRNYGIYIICAAYIIIYVFGIIRGEFIVKHVFRGGSSSPFTLYFGPPYSFVTILAKLFGLFLFILSLLGVIFFLKQKEFQAKLIGYTYLGVYFVSFLSLLFLFMHPSRVVHALGHVCLFAIAGGILYVWELASKLPLIRASNKKKTYAAVICGIIILSLAFVHIVVVINKEPSIIEHDFPASLSVLKFGAVDPSVASYELIQFINMQVEQNSHILATPATQQILASSTHITPVSIGYSNFEEQFWIYVRTKQAMALDGKKFEEYIEKYNVTYVVYLSGKSVKPRATRVSKIYETSRGEKVCWIDKTK